MPACRYQIFSDGPSERERYHSKASDSFTTYPNDIEPGRRNFGSRGKFQMQWALDHVPHFTYFLRVDEDGYLCLDSLFAVINAGVPKSKFLWGRFHCKKLIARMDENFMFMSRDVVTYFVEGWRSRQVAYDGRLTLALNVGAMLSRLHHVCGWTFWDDRHRIRWEEKLTDRMDCRNHIWFHHLKPEQIKLFHQRHHERGRPTIASRNSLSKPALVPFVNKTGCKWGPGLPPFNDMSHIPITGNTSHINGPLSADLSTPVAPCKIFPGQVG